VVSLFVIAVLAVSDIFQPKDVPSAEAAGVPIITTDIDTCGIATSVTGNFTKSGAGTCYIKSTTGLINGNLIVSGGAKIRIQTGAQLVLAPGKEIIIDKGSGSEIIMETGGAVDKGVVHGTVCVRDDDLDGYMNSGTGFAVALNSQPCSSLNNGAAKYIAKTSAASLTEADCYNTDAAKFSCCSNGYRDYDKDGYGRSSDGYSCYAADASYNVVANNYDCNDSVAGITTNNTDYTSCGSGACAGSGSNVCTNGVTVNNACVVSAQACCDASGNPRPNGTAITSCSSCNGTAATPIAYANGTICAYGSYGAYGNSAGSCNIYSSRPYYTCSAGSCSGSVAGYDYQYQYPPALGNVWNSSSWITANCSTNTGYGSGYYCSGSGLGSTSQRLSYGCNTGGGGDTSSPTATCNQSTCNNRNENGVSCSGGVCVGSSNCADGIDNDSDGLTDAADSACGGCGQCTPSSCCSSNGCFANGGICSYGGWSAWAAGGSCYLYRTRAYYTWTNCSCNYAGTDYEYNFGANGQVVSGTSFVAANSSNKCGTGSYSCSGNTSIQLGYYACNGGNSCSTYMGTYQTGTCTGGENNMCSGGSCQNYCTSGGPDNNGNGFNDAQDPACPYGGAGQCNSGGCCNTANGSYYGYGTVYSYGSCASPVNSGASCTYTYNNQICSGSSANWTGNYAGSGATCYCPNGTKWNGSSCAAAGASNYCGTGSSYSCSGNNQLVNVLGCNGSGSCSYNTGATIVNQTCSNATSYYCSGNQSYYRTNGCISGSCSYFDVTNSYCDGVSKVCSSGSCVSPSCSAGTYSGFSVPTLTYGASTSVTKPACYRSSGGYYSATATCNSGSISITGVSGPNCYGGYQYTYGTWYQSTYGCYDVCVLSTCSAGYVYGTVSYPSLSHQQTYSTSAVIGGGSCNISMKCSDGSVNVTGDSCTCRASYRQSGSTYSNTVCTFCGAGTYGTTYGQTSCVTCEPGYYCLGGSWEAGYTHQACPAGTTSSAGATSASSCVATEYCGNGRCTWAGYYEDCNSCPQDCGGCPCSDPEDCPSNYCQGYDAWCQDWSGYRLYYYYSRWDCEYSGYTWHVNYYGTCG
jgi:hypothetical protein